LLFEQFLFAGHVAAITFGEHVLARGFNIGARDHTSARRGLDGHIE
jgi:hypothetical protein